MSDGHRKLAVSNGRRFSLELLEPRRLLAGVTLITHGYEPTSSDLPGWVESMANAIASQAGSGTAIYDLRIALNSAGAAQVTSFTQVSGPLFSASTNGQAVIMLDWADVSGVIPSVSYFSTASIAQLVEPYLLDSDPNLGITAPLADFPIHLIGHSRGASVVSTLAEDLGQSGIWVDQLTTLDPHPVLSDPAVNAYSNVVFADNYYETDSLLTYGAPVQGAHNADLSGVLTSGDEHSDVHAYYDGTIDTSATDDGDGIVIDPTWYDSQTTGPRDGTGFYYSLIDGGTRPADGIGQAFGGSVARPSVPNVSGPQWANIGNLQLTDSGSQFQIGQALHAQFVLQDSDSAAQVSFWLDNDQNPLDGAVSYLGATSVVAGSGVLKTANPVTLNTSNVSAGQYYLEAEIQNSQSTRYAYDSTPITLINPALVSISGVVDQDITGNGPSSDDTPLGGVTINLYESNGTTLVSTTTTAPDGTYSFENLPAGSYVWREVVPTGWTQTYPAGQYGNTLTSGQMATGNFGDFENISISGTALNDLTGNGFSTDDTPLSGLTVQLFLNGDTTAIESMTTLSDGSYNFPNLGHGAYSVQEVVPTGWTQTGGIGGYTVNALSGQNVPNEDFDDFQPSFAPPPTVTYLPDLSGTLTAPSSLLLGDESGPVSLTISNTGNLAFSGRVPIDLYASQGTTYDSSDPLIVSYHLNLNLAPGDMQTWTLKFPVPTSISPGNYFLLAFINQAQTLPESDYTNNTAVTSSTTAIAPPTPPDLTGSIDYAPTSLPLGAKTNPLVLTISNLGDTRLTGSVPINLYASQSANYDASAVLIASLSAKMNLPGGGGKVLTLRFGSPANVPDGNYYLIAFINQGQTLQEGDYTNNTAAASATTTITQPFIDPTGSFFSVPSILYEGARASAVITVTNNGNVPAIGVITAQLLFSPGNSTGTGATLLGTQSKKLSLGVGKSTRIKVSFDVPVSADGTYLEGLISFSGAMSDSDLSDNMFFSGLPVTISEKTQLGA